MKDNQKFVDILLTDINLHTIKPRKPVSLGRKISKSITSGKSGRAFSPEIKIKKNGTVEFAMTLSDEAFLKAKKQGKQLRIMTPKEGIPIFASEDFIERLKAKVKKQKSSKKKLDK